MYTSTIHNTISEENMEMYNKIDETGIFGRNLELFFPLLLTAKIINNAVFEDILKIVSNLNSSKKEDEFTESKDISLIEFVSLAERYRFEYKFTHELKDEFKEFIGTHGEEDDRWITTTWFGTALKRLNLIGIKKRVAKGVLIMLAVDRAKEKMGMFKAKDDSSSVKNEITG